MIHTFAISAYRESPYLEECVRSLKGQRQESEVIICTSTPCGYINAIAKKYGIAVYVRDGVSSLKDDWNFAVDMAVKETGAVLVTVAHQDDVYCSGYTASLMEALRKYPDMSLFCTRYRTIDKYGNTIHGKAESVKRVLRLPLRLRALAGTTLIKRAVLMPGNSICCPSCTYNIERTGLPLFLDNDSFVTDWKALLRLSELPGRFVCEERELLCYRVHDGAATRASIDNHTREREEYEVYSMLWPRPVAGLLAGLMKGAYSAYR